MSQHDPLCPVEDYSVPYLCLCELIEMVRDDERAQMRLAEDTPDPA